MENVTSVYLDKEQMQKFELLKQSLKKFNPNISNTDVWREIIDFALKSQTDEDLVDKYSPNQKTKMSLRLNKDDVDTLSKKTGLNKSDSLKYCLDLI